MPIRNRVIVVAALAMALAAFYAVRAGEGPCCANCGCHSSCNKVCRLVCEEKKVEVVCWNTECEDFCVPGPSKPGCKHCEPACDECALHGKKFVWTEWIPGCAEIHTKKKLMKKTIVKKVPSYKWVVEDLCKDCEAKAPAAPIQPGMVVPKPPAMAANVKIVR
jgi:hypothetical protein